MSQAPANPLRQLPSVNELAEAPALADWLQRLPRSMIVEAARRVLDDARTQLRAHANSAPMDMADLAAQVAARLHEADRPPLASTINATGIIIHTGLGRSPLAEAAVDALADAALHYAPVELDMATGQRGRRADVVRDLLCQLTGAESATVVNNCAAALLIALDTLAKGRQVIVSRGELIEIGGSFRLPDVMAASGAVLREVGTTNKTRASDYRAAIGDHTGALMKVHPSNYLIAGFTEEATIAELAALAHDGQTWTPGGEPLPVIHDIGSGALTEMSALGREPVARASIEAGADLVLFSGDKLLGGPQAGILVGSAQVIARIEANPLMRALRVDKLTLAALAATLQLHRDPHRAVRDVPVLAMLHAPIDVLTARADRICRNLDDLDGAASVEAIDTTAYLGGGSLPAQGLASAGVRITPMAISEGELMTRLRRGRPPIVARAQGGAVILDMRTIFPQQDAAVTKAIRQAVGLDGSADVS